MMIIIYLDTACHSTGHSQVILRCLLSRRVRGNLAAPQPTMYMATEGARIDDLRVKSLQHGVALSTDQLRERLVSCGGDVKKAADAIAAVAATTRPSEKPCPQTPPGLRTPAKPSLIVPDFALVPEAPPMPPPVVRVGVGVVVRRQDGRILIGERQGSHGASKLALPGGHLEMNESWDDCARREVEEETGLVLDSTMLAMVTNDPMPAEGKHYITIFMVGDAPVGQEPVNREPHKCKGWEWMTIEELHALPEGKLFIPMKHFLEAKPKIFDEAPRAATSELVPLPESRPAAEPEPNGAAEPVAPSSPVEIQPPLADGSATPPLPQQEASEPEPEAVAAGVPSPPASSGSAGKKKKKKKGA